MHTCTLVKKLRITAWSVSREMLSGVRTEDGRPRGFLHVTEPSSRHCLAHRRIAFGDWASCWFRSRRNLRWVSVIDLVWINSSTAHTRSPTPQRSMLIKSETCVQIPALRDTLAQKHVTKMLKCFTISAALCIKLGFVSACGATPEALQTLSVACPRYWSAMPLTGHSERNSTAYGTVSTRGLLASNAHYLWRYKRTRSLLPATGVSYLRQATDSETWPLTTSITLTD